MTGLTRSTALEGRAYDIACGQIDIGNAATEMTTRMRDGILQPNGETAVEPTMNVENAANAVVHMAGLPLDANVLFMTVMATNAICRTWMILVSFPIYSLNLSFPFARESKGFHHKSSFLTDHWSLNQGIATKPKIPIIRNCDLL